MSLNFEMDLFIPLERQKGGFLGMRTDGRTDGRTVYQVRRSGGESRRSACRSSSSRASFSASADARISSRQKEQMACRLPLLS